MKVNELISAFFAGNIAIYGVILITLLRLSGFGDVNALKTIKAIHYWILSCFVMTFMFAFLFWVLLGAIADSTAPLPWGIAALVLVVAFTLFFYERLRSNLKKSLAQRFSANAIEKCLSTVDFISIVSWFTLGLAGLLARSAVEHSSTIVLVLLFMNSVGLVFGFFWKFMATLSRDLKDFGSDSDCREPD